MQSVMENIKVQENYFYKLDNLKEVKVIWKKYDKANILEIGIEYPTAIVDLDRLAGIKITDEWLLKFGFFNNGFCYNLEDFKIKNIDNFYKKEILKYLPNLVETYAKKMNLIPTSIKYRKNKRTWGSCNYKNGLNFNILLMKFPLELMEYVIIHELAHIKHKNHSKSFWDLVEVYCPDYKKREKIFKNFL